uniref:Scavenger receptor class C, type II, isoform A n=2 Tax=Drosophila melanogaster TaxID=7227 RepID=A1Z8V0_DROME|nr:scavenger receptor class C, type II, isoform B [Drosophila melanogaster]NP_524720.2 scavenger receptor class C, type II, isoform A [Drosophila melanogaster]AAF58551.1 scavenger receptor class C, type II, isoform A [Drosophila melanogaster]ADV37155.1 scavenger receptor class C, type II, isoform B [Drosophila melanogaster]|eukprot:NP_001188908.1 scavenger receptor class C, type II, isoform B [Drosophila melanogaster]
MQFFLALTLILAYSLDTANGSCEGSLDLENGRFFTRSNNLVIFQCNRGFVLQGNSIHTCDRDGRLREKKPFCARKGCDKPEDPTNGYVLDNPVKAEIVCLDGFVLYGSRTAFCDGEKWSTQLGACRRSNHTMDHSCDFESEDQCGWSAEETIWLPWKRISAVTDFHHPRTGPRYDHTFGNTSGGHYMRMETQIEAYGSYHFVSPVYPRSLCLNVACCFRFHYFMFGAGVDRLVLSVKPASLQIDDMWNSFRSNSSKFEITGSQGTHWLENTITIDKMHEDFQVVFTATDARSQFGDIAIDDVKLMTGSECGVDGYSTTTTTESASSAMSSSEEPLVFDMMSCTFRCGSISPGSPLFSDEGIVMSCGCDDSCILNNNCCPNYFEKCVKELDIGSNVFLNSANTTTTSISRNTTTEKVFSISLEASRSFTTPRTSTNSTTFPRTQISTKKLLNTHETLTETSTIPTRNKKLSQPSIFSSQHITVTTTTDRSRKDYHEDIAGQLDMNTNIPHPALIVMYLLIGVILVIVVANLKQLCKILSKNSSRDNEKVVSFKKAFEGLRKPRRLSQNCNGMDQHLCSAFDEDLDYFEDMDMNIRMVTDL